MDSESSDTNPAHVAPETSTGKLRPERPQRNGYLFSSYVGAWQGIRKKGSAQCSRIKSVVVDPSPEQKTP